MTNRAATRWVLALTVVAAVLRFTRLSFPAALTDEAFTYWRTCGNFRELLEAIRPDAFVPLHYLSVWLFTKMFGHAIWVLRLPGAIAGVAMPYAMYLLGRSIFDRRVGVFAAIIGVTNAYFAFFARDAKMYMPAWCELTFAVAFALLYARTGKRNPLIWALGFGILAANTHAVTLLILPMLPALIAATAPRGRWKRAAMGALVLLPILAGPVIYYSTFNRWYTQSGGLSGVQEDGAPAERDNGLMWIGSWQRGRSPRNLLISCVSDYLVAYEWPVETPNDPPDWHGAWAGSEAYAIARSSLWAIATIVTLALIRQSLSRKPSRHAGGRLFLLTLLVAVPLYGFYLRSFEELHAPWRILPGETVAFAGAIAAAIVMTKGWRFHGWVRVLGAMMVLIGLWGVMTLLHAHAPRWNSLWMPRYSGVVAPFLLVALAAAVARLRGRGFILTALVSVNLLACGARIFTYTEWPHDLQATDMVRAAKDPKTLLAGTLHGIPGFLPAPYYHLAVAANLDLAPQTFRDGNTWPYRAGSGMATILGDTRPSPLPLIRLSRKYKDAQRLIVWLGATNEVPTYPGWVVKDRQTFHVRFVWTWETMGSSQRIEYVRSSDHPTTRP